MLNAKCHAMRDAQLLQKDIIRQNLEEEEESLEHLMEIERQKAIAEENEGKRKEDRPVAAVQFVQRCKEMECNAQVR